VASPASRAAEGRAGSIGRTRKPECHAALSPEERSHRHFHDGAVLGGVKGSLAALGGSAALDTASAARRSAFVDGTPDLWMPFVCGKEFRQ